MEPSAQLECTPAASGLPRRGEGTGGDTHQWGHQGSQAGQGCGGLLGLSHRSTWTELKALAAAGSPPEGC